MPTPNDPVTRLELALAMEHVRGYMIKLLGAQVAAFSQDKTKQSEALEAIFDQDREYSKFVSALYDVEGADG